MWWSYHKRAASGRFTVAAFRRVGEYWIESRNLETDERRLVATYYFAGPEEDSATRQMARGAVVSWANAH